MFLHLKIAMRWDDEDISKRGMLELIKRLAKSEYYDKYAVEVACGCRAIGTHYVSYSGSCELHMQLLFGKWMK